MISQTLARGPSAMRRLLLLAALVALPAAAAERSQIQLGLGNYDGFVAALEQSDVPGVSFQPYLWPEYRAYNDDPRFRAVLEKFGLPLPPRGDSP